MLILRQQVNPPVTSALPIYFPRMATEGRVLPWPRLATVVSFVDMIGLGMRAVTVSCLRHPIENILPDLDMATALHQHMN